MRTLYTSLVVGLLSTGCLTPTSDEIATTSEDIIGGTDAAITDHPWQVHLQTLAVDDIVVTDAGASLPLKGAACGGAIISPHWVATATHCLSDFEVSWGSQDHLALYPAFTRVVAGTADVGEPISGGSVHDIIEYVVVPGWTGQGSGGSDFAMVRVRPPFTLNGTTIDSIKMLRPKDEQRGLADSGVSGTVAGWGLTSNGGSTSDLLQVLPVTLWSNTELQGVTSITVLDDMLGAYSGMAGKGACSGDSGGPLVVQRSGEPRLAGVASFVISGQGEDPCASGRPDVYARAAYYEQWSKEVRASQRTKVLHQDISPGSGTGPTTYYFSFEVPEDAISLDVRMRQLNIYNQDLDMTVKHTDVTPFDASDYDCSGKALWAEEYCPIPSPAAGTWTVRVEATTVHTDIRLTAHVRTEKPKTPFMSEYFEGVSNGQAIEIYNPGPGLIRRKSCELRFYHDGSSTPGTTITIADRVRKNETYVVCSSDFSGGTCDQVSLDTFFDGDDVIELYCNGASADFFGQIGVTGAFASSVFRRDCAVGAGDTIGDDVFVVGNEWNQGTQDDTSDLGSHVCP